MQIEISKGEGVRAEMRWTNKGDGTPIDLTGRTLAIVEAYPVALTGGTCEVLDATDGRAAIVIPTELAAQMGVGRTNWIRIGMSLPGGELDTTPQIWIEVE